MDRPVDVAARALERLLGRCAGLLPPERRGWAEAVRAEAGEVPAGTARLGWLAGGLWLVAREAGMIRRIAYGLGIAAVSVTAALTVRYLWSGAQAGPHAGWDKARILLLIALLAGLPWVARRRGVFGPVGGSVAARVVRAGGSAALVALVLDLARVEHFPGPALSGPWNSSAGPWYWAHEAAALVLIDTCLTAVLRITARTRVRPALMAWCAAAAGLVLFFTVAPVQVLIAVYAAGILVMTARRSPVTPATLAISAGIGTGGGLLVVALWNPTRSAPGPGLTEKTNVPLLFILLILVIAAGTTAAGAFAARRAGDKNDPLELKARARQYLAAGPLTAASAALMLPLLRASHATHVAAVCQSASASAHPFHCTAAPAVWMIFLVAGPMLGLAFGTIGVAASQPPRPAHEPPPGGTRSGGFFVKI